MFGIFLRLSKIFTFLNQDFSRTHSPRHAEPWLGKHRVRQWQNSGYEHVTDVSDFATVPGGMQTQPGEKVSEKVSGNTFTNER
jgi:hypothetical protein